MSISPSSEFLKKYFNGKKIKFAEIGVGNGEHFSELLSNIDIEKAYAIDIWGDYVQEEQVISTKEYYNSICEEYKDTKKVSLIKKESLEAVNNIPNGSLDLVYVDGNRQYEFIRQDISAWVHKVKDGGIVCGSGYNCSWTGVTRAVNQFIMDCDLELHVKGKIVQDWWFIKPCGINHLPIYSPPIIKANKRLKILALTWTTFDNETELMINARRDLICPAVDGLTNELLNLGHTVIYVNVFAEYKKDIPKKDLDCPAMISGLKYYLWQDIKTRDFDLIWHCVKDPTPPQALPYFKKIMEELDPKIPVLNDVEKLKDHTKRKYITLMRKKNVGAIILDDYTDWLKADGTIDFANKCHPVSQGCYVSLDYHAIRLANTNSQRTNLNQDGITLKYHNTSKYPGAKPGVRSFFRVPYAAGKCLQGWKYYCPENILCPKSGAAVEKVPYSIPEMTAGTVSAAMNELGVDIAHIEGVEAGFTCEIFDINPFPSSSGATLTPMSIQMAKRIEQVYDI